MSALTIDRVNTSTSLGSSMSPLTVSKNGFCVYGTYTYTIEDGDQKNADTYIVVILTLSDSTTHAVGNIGPIATGTGQPYKVPCSYPSATFTGAQLNSWFSTTSGKTGLISGSA